MRKGEMTKRALDRDYPHQVELRADLTTGKNYDIALAFCHGLSLAPRGHHRRKGDTRATAGGVSPGLLPVENSYLRLQIPKCKGNLALRLEKRKC